MNHKRHANRSDVPLPMLILCSFLLVGCVLDYVSPLLGIDMWVVSRMASLVCWLILVSAAVVAGGRKARCLYVAEKGLVWLARMPWAYGKPLPLVSPFLEKRDILQLGVVSSAALVLWGLHLQPFVEFMERSEATPGVALFFHPALPVVVYLLPYVVAMLFFLWDKNTLIQLGGAFLLPFAVYPFGDPSFACAILMFVCVCCCFGFQRYLRGFPWNTDLWNMDRAQMMRDARQRIGMVSGSNKYLNPMMDVKEISLFKAIVISALVLWWFHTMAWVVDYQMVFSFMCFIAVVLAIARIGMYWSLGARPPIGFIGRIRNGRWIIPKYDKVFIAPVCVVLVGALGPLVLKSMMFPAWLSLRLVFFFVWFLVLWLPPSRRTWAYTGAHGFVVQERLKQRSGGSRQLGAVRDAKVGGKES